MEKDITLETKVWEEDWELIMRTNRLSMLQERCGIDFSKRTLFINNVSDIDKVKRVADVLVNRDIIDDYVVVSDYAQVALESFKLTKEDLGSGYYYSISELVSIYLCKTEYLLHFSGDSLPEKGLPNDWVNHLTDVLDNKELVKVANLVWNSRYKEAKKESIDENDTFFLGFGFSDQMYLIKANDFNKAIYSEKNVASERYPAYGGELFEKRVDSWMRNHNYMRATYKFGSYQHKNFTRNKLLKKIQLKLNKAL